MKTAIRLILTMVVVLSMSLSSLGGFAAMAEDTPPPADEIQVIEEELVEELVEPELEEPPMEEPPLEEPVFQLPPVEEPGLPPVDEPEAELPAIEEPVFDLPAFDAMMVEIPSFEYWWDGNHGIDSEKCDYAGQPGRPDTGWIHWVFTDKGTSTNAELLLGGTGSGTYSPGEPLTANVWHFYTPFFELDGLTAMVTLFGGDAKEQAKLVISDYCPGKVYTLEVKKDAKTEYTRTYEWEIKKSVDPAVWDLFKGDTGTSTWTVEVVRTYKDSAWKVSGSIYIYNPDPVKTAVLTSVTDVISPDIEADVVCPAMVVAPKSTLTCTYSADLPDAASRTNTATVTTDGVVKGSSGTAAVVFGDPTDIVGYPTVNVSDTNGKSWTASDSATWTYDETFACSADKGKHKNTATITETGQFAEAEVLVNCHELKVKKSAWAEYTRKFTWTLDKTGDKDYLMLPVGMPYDVNYEVTVDATYIDKDFKVSGFIWVRNPAPIPAEILGVTDVITGGIMPEVKCGVEFPYLLEAGATLVCSYKSDLPDKEARINKATAKLQNYAYDQELVGTPAGTTAFWGTAWIGFFKPTKLIDNCVMVFDSRAGYLGSVCYGDLPKTFTYTLTVGPYEDCDQTYTFKNVANLVTNTTRTWVWDEHTVKIEVPCGCTLTPGYWKTHSKYGPAPYDPTWALIGEDTPFFSSGKTWYQAINTAPKGGDAYYILAHAYIAAKLNYAAGASQRVNDQIAFAEIFFSTYGPGTKLSKDVRADAIAAAYILDQYNNGYMGVPHCGWTP